MNRKFLCFIFFLIFIFMAGVSAGDVNHTDSDFSAADSECCSFIIQEESETVFAFRQDAPLNGFGVDVHNDTWDDMEIIRQEIDTEGSYFTHAIITQDGWVFSQGGSQFNNNSIAIENVAREIILSDNISMTSLGEIQDVLKKFEYGHVLIKAPDGRFGVVYYNHCFTGILQQGEFLIVPNIYNFFRTGNYTDYSIDPVDAIVRICSYENSGWNKRNLYVYDYKAYNTENGQKYGISLYVTNDNSYNTGLNASKIVTHFWYNGNFYNISEIPEIPDTIYVGNYIFNKTSSDSVFEVISYSKSALVNEVTSVNYRINNIYDEKTVVFELGEDVEFIDAEVSYGEYNYDLNQHALYWNFSSSNSSKQILLNIKPKTKGNFTIRAYIQDMDKELNITVYATNPGVNLTADNVTTYKTYYKNLDVYLTDEDGVPLVGEIVSITVDGTTYYREVTPKGYASLPILMQPGEYDASILYDGIFGESQCNSKITVNKTLFSSDLEYFYGDVSEYSVICLDGDGNNATDYEIDFSVDGRLFDRWAKDGVASINISNLKPGNHTIISYNLVTNEYFKNSILVKSISAGDVVKIFKNDTQYFATFVDGNGTRLSSANVSFEINGVTYTRTTDENGTARLNINLGEGTYILTATNPETGDIETSNITVIGLLETSNLTKYYKNDTQFVVRVLTQDGNYAGAGEEVVFNINGVFYTRTTNATGHAKLNINLSPGNTTVTVYYKDCAQGYNIEVLPVISASDLNMKYGDGSNFEAKLVDGAGNPYANQIVTFNINGFFYNRTTDASGIAKLNINLMKGEYIITSTYNGCNVANKITVS